jgi:putative transposase
MVPSEAKAQAVKDLLAGLDGERTGSELLSELVRRSTEQVVQHLLEEEQSEFLGRDRYERGSAGVYRNGYESRKLRTAEGVMEVDLPQVRGTEGPYRSEVWAGLSKNSEVLKQIVTEMYVRGLSVRDVEEAMQTATGDFVLSDSSVSRVTEQLNEQYEAFRQQDLSDFDIAYLFVDAVYEPLRRYGVRTAILCAWGVSTSGSRVLLNLVAGTSEKYETCIDFLRDMVRRGLSTPLTVTSDGAAGMIKAIDTLWPATARCRCWFHKMQNLQAKIPSPAWPQFKALVADVRDAPDLEKARQRLERLIETNKRDFPEACRSLEEDPEALLNHLIVPRRHRVLVRTTNLVERSIEEERRRTKTIPNLWDEKSTVKLVFATLIRVSSRWSTTTRFNEHERAQVRRIKEERGIGTTATVDDPPSRKRRSASRVAA